jgi:5-hydroxyisourate hydrolase
MGISTHILDTSRGRPAQGVAVVLEQQLGSTWQELARGATDADGRVKPLLATIPTEGTFRISFEVAPYFQKLGSEAFFPRVQIEFLVKAKGEHYHVPLLLNPFGYSTYRGS